MDSKLLRLGSRRHRGYRERGGPSDPFRYLDPSGDQERAPTPPMIVPIVPRRTDRSEGGGGPAPYCAAPIGTGPGNLSAHPRGSITVLASARPRVEPTVLRTTLTANGWRFVRPCAYIAYLAHLTTRGLCEARTRTRRACSVTSQTR